MQLSSASAHADRQVLGTGASGVVGRRLAPVLETYDFLARSDEYWQLIEQVPLLTFEQAALRALDEESRHLEPGPARRALEGLIDLLAGGRIR